jgi:thioesterase domain-containing protein/NAD(P)-dependent dehydrogenase (short-subunit alcohol dehydrogenase family)/aryl carrier-like protein
MAQGRHAGKLVLVPAAGDASAAGFRADGTYLVTGGLGGIGPELAAWMAERGAGTVVLAGRRPPDGATALRIDELRARGHRIELEVADVLAPEGLAALLERTRALPPLRGIVHAAGVVDDAALPQQSWDRFARVLLPKALGAWNLRRAARAAPLDFIALFGSLSSVLGLPGQANHAGANALLDALARDLSASGLPAVSVSWGAWDRFGYAARTGSLAHLARRGVAPLPPELAFAALERALARRAPHVVVCAFDWERLFASWHEAGLGPRFASWRPAAPAPAIAERPRVEAPAAPAPAPATAAAAPTAGASAIADRLRRSVGDVLGASPDAIDLDRPISALGLDSLGVVELRNRWRRQLACDLPVDWPSRFPTLRAVADHIAPPPPPAPSPTTPAPPPAPALAARIVALAAPPPPVVCIHPAGGSVADYADLARRLAHAGHAVIAVEHAPHPGEPFASLEELAREHVRALRATARRGPHRLLGWSVGGALAHAMAAELERAGDAVELLCVVDPPAASPDGTIAPLDLLAVSFGADTYRTILDGPPEPLQPIRALPRRDLPAMAADLAAAALAAGLLRAPLAADSAAEQMIRIGGHLALARRYRPAPVRAPLLAIIPTRRAESARARAAWAAWSSGPLTLLEVEGDHFSIIRAPSLDAWAPELLARFSPDATRRQPA